jgi:hypothetical protein
METSTPATATTLRPTRVRGRTRPGWLLLRGVVVLLGSCHHPAIRYTMAFQQHTQQPPHALRLTAATTATARVIPVGVMKGRGPSLGVVAAVAHYHHHDHQQLPHEEDKKDDNNNDNNDSSNNAAIVVGLSSILDDYGWSDRIVTLSEHSLPRMVELQQDGTLRLGIITALEFDKEDDDDDDDDTNESNHNNNHKPPKFLVQLITPTSTISTTTTTTTELVKIDLGQLTTVWPPSRKATGDDDDTILQVQQQ